MSSNPASLSNGWTEELDRLKAENAAQAAEIERLTKERKRAPVQGFSAGIPWEMHLRAYDAYCKKYGKQQALIEGGCRGGFGTQELDAFIPGWRDELSTISALAARATAAEAKVAALTEALKDARSFAEQSGHAAPYFLKELDAALGAAQ